MPVVRSLFLAGSLFIASLAPAQVGYKGGTYVQDFNSLPSTGTYPLASPGPVSLADAPIGATGLGGWSIGVVSGGTLRFLVDSGLSNTGALYSYGPTGSPDRALGSLASGTAFPRLGAVFVNLTGQPIHELTLAYTGQQWRNGLSGTANTLRFSYSFGGTSIADPDGTFTELPDLHLVSPVVGTAGATILDGQLPENQRNLVAQLKGVTWEPGQTLVIRWLDVNDFGVDDALAIDNFTLSTDAKPGPLTVTATNPADGAVNQAPNRSLTLSFNHPVDLQGRWYRLTGSVTGDHPATISGGPFSFALKPVSEFAFGETVTVRLIAANIIDRDSGLPLPADVTFSFTTFQGPSVVTAIHDVQGTSTASPLTGQTVRVQGVVTGAFQSTTRGLRGFFVQLPDAEVDGSPTTSEGIFVADNGSAIQVTPGQSVTVVGTVSETNGLTQLTPVFSVQVNGLAPLPTAIELQLPLPTTAFLERFESMRVVLPQTLTVTNNFALGTAGEIQLSVGRLYQPTNVTAPGAPANAVQAQNNLNLILINDGSTASNPDPTPFTFALSRTLRTGSTVAGLTGILTVSGGTFRVEPTVPPDFVEANPRTAPPVVGGSLRIVGANVLNYFNGNGFGGGFPTARGATTLVEFERQRAKLIASLLALQADIYGLTEIENDGYGPSSAIQDIVNGLNAAEPDAGFAAVAPAFALGTDQIKVALIYRGQTVEMVRDPATTNHTSFSGARPPLAQTFRELSSGQKLTVCVNHFRAKASVANSDPLNQDRGDGQGTNNFLRVQEAEALTAWLATDPTASGDPDFLIIGDLNSYALEDPISALKAAGYIDLTRTFEGPAGYSYAFSGQFGHLDHALASPSLTSQVTGAQAWHSNSDEPIYLDYNLEGKSAAQAEVNVGTPYRTADHDPILIGVSLVPPQVALIGAQPAPQTVDAGGTATFTVTASGTPTLTYQWTREGKPIAGATLSTLTLTNVPRSAAGDYRVEIWNAGGLTVSEAAHLTVRLTYAAWLDEAGFGPRSDRAPLGDPDRDGVLNLLEFVQNTSPVLASSASTLRVRPSGSGAIVEYRRRLLLGGVTAQLETSSDLQGWAPAGEGQLVDQLDSETGLYRLELSGVAAFVRLRATLAPEAR